MSAVQARWKAAQLAPSSPRFVDLRSCGSADEHVRQHRHLGGMASRSAATHDVSPSLGEADVASTSGTARSDEPLASSSTASIDLFPSLIASSSLSTSPAGVQAAATLPSFSPTPRRPLRPALTRLDTSERIKAYDVASTATLAAIKTRNVSQTLSLDMEGVSRQSSFSNLTQISGASTSPYNTSLSGCGSMSSASSNMHSTGVFDNVPYESSFGEDDVRKPVLDEEAFSKQGYKAIVAHKLAQAPNLSLRTFSLSSGAIMTTPFEPSEVIDGFLFVGPEITTKSEVTYLQERLGIKRILNAAWEIESGGGKHLNLDSEEESGFQKYLKLPLKDTVEAEDVQQYLEEACVFLDDARRHSAPTYVHCKAGKSRSVMLVMAYLIHHNAWSLQRSYAYVVERRRDVSPNIGFVAELMAFESKRRAMRDGAAESRDEQRRLQHSVPAATPSRTKQDDEAEYRRPSLPFFAPTESSQAHFYDEPTEITPGDSKHAVGDDEGPQRQNSDTQDPEQAVKRQGFSMLSIQSRIETDEPPEGSLTKPTVAFSSLDLNL